MTCSSFESTLYESGIKELFSAIVTLNTEQYRNLWTREWKKTLSEKKNWYHNSGRILNGRKEASKERKESGEEERETGRQGGQEEENFAQFVWQMNRMKSAFDRLDCGKLKISFEPTLVTEDGKLASPILMWLEEHGMMGYNTSSALDRWPHHSLNRMSIISINYHPMKP